MAIQVKKNGRTGRWMMIAALAGAVFFGSFAFAQAKGAVSAGAGGTVVSNVVPAPTAGAGASPSGSASGACACCGGAAVAPAQAQVPKAAELAGGVQRISVDVSKGYYDPSTIELKAGVPAEITFGQGSGCTGQVQSRVLGFSEDISAGPRTVKLPGLGAGTYEFACGMNMVFGSIVVR